MNNDHFKWAEHLLLAGFLSLYGLIVIFGNFSVIHEQQYIRLAESFLSGHLYFISMPEHWLDTVKYAGHYYWPLGPFPAILLMPFVFIFRLANLQLFLGYISLPLSMWTGWLCFKLANKCGRSKEDSVWLMLAFCGASSYLSIAAISMSWSFGHVVAVSLLFLSLHEWLGHRRWWLLGFLLGLTMATRITAGLNIAFFAGNALLSGKNQRLKALISLAVGFIIPIIFLGAYNLVRFDSIIETGYNNQQTLTGDFTTTSIMNILPHLRIFLFGLPNISNHFQFIVTNPFGMSVLLLSPWLLYICFIKFNRSNLLAFSSCIIVLMAVLAWKSTGQLQVGYRFILDFLPIIIFIFANDKKCSLGFKILVGLGFLLNIYFLYSFIGIMPQG